MARKCMYYPERENYRRHEKGRKRYFDYEDNYEDEDLNKSAEERLDNLDQHKGESGGEE